MADTKKELGQHWLKDISILEAIAEAADVSEDDFVLEIGPGLGTLTDVLAAKAGKVMALEYDSELIGSLSKKYTHHNNVEVREGDIRTFNFSELPLSYKIVANIPYYLTSHLIRSISETNNPPELAVLLIQKEVAERICAKPGKMGILSVTAQYYFECTLDIEVPAEYFTPPPKVDSQVVSLRRKQNMPLAKGQEKSFFRLVKAGFSEKRKTLRNSLSGGLGTDKSNVDALCEKAGISSQSRAQTLSMEQWLNLYAVFSAQ